MSNKLTILEPSGNLVNQATQQTRPNTVFGEAVQKVITPPQSVPGQFGNFEGDLSMANTVSNLGAKLDDLVTRENSLKRANESERRKLHIEELKEADFKARNQVDETSYIQQLNADKREQLYNQYLDDNVSAVNAKYKYTTDVGNNIEDEISRLITHTRVAFKKENEQYRVDEYKATQKISWDKSVVNVIEGVRRGKDVTESINELNQVFGSLDTPAFHGVYGNQAETIKLDWKKKATEDMIKSLPTETAVALLGYKGDPAFDKLAFMDQSVRVSLHREMNGILSEENAEAKKARIEQQTEDLKKFYDIAREENNTRKLSEAKNQVYTKRDRGEIDTTAAALVLDRLDARIDSSIRRSQADAHTAEIRAQTETTKMIAAAEKADRQRDNAYSGVAKDNNDFYNQYVAPTLKGKTAAEQMLIQERYVVESGRVPQSLRWSLEKDVNNPDQKIAGLGIERLARIEQLAPSAYQDLPEDVKAVHQLSNRVSITEAQETIRKNKNRSREETESVKKSTFKKLNDEFVSSSLSDHFGTKIVSPSIAEAIKSTAVALIDTYGNPEDAFSAAMKRYEAKGFGTSEIGGTERIVQFPPEKTYAAEMGGEKAVLQAWETDVVKGMNLSENARPSYSGRVDKSGKPLYFIINEEGNYISKDGKALVWQPSYETSPLYELAKKNERRTQAKSMKTSPLMQDRNKGTK